jgi:hypothetical protein
LATPKRVAMLESDPVDQLLDRYERESIHDESEALAAVALVAEAINRGLVGVNDEEREQRVRRKQRSKRERP